MSNSKLTLSHQARMDIAHYIRHCNYEIGGFGYVTMTDDGDFYVDQVFIVEQTVTGTDVDFTDAGLAYAINKAIEDDRIDDLRFCWHSHVEMNAFWSNTDETMIANLNNGITPYFVSLVQNKRGEHEQRVDFFPPPGPFSQFAPQVTYELDLYHDLTDIPEHIKKSYDELVTVKTFPLTNKSSSRPTITTGRKEYILEKVADSGYQSLTAVEQDHYDEMLYEQALSQYGGQGLWDDDAWDYAYGSSTDSSATTGDNDTSDFWDDDFKPSLSDAERKALSA